MEEMQKRLDAIYEAIDRLKSLEPTSGISEELERLQDIAEKIEIKINNSREAWDKVQLARMIERPRSRYYIEAICDEFIELHGDRAYADDTAIIGGIGTIGGKVVTIIAHNRGSSSKENIQSNFGMAHPEGYRKALRLMKQAEKFKRPIVCLVDTAGAYCGMGAEERGQGQAIATNLFQMSQLKVPIISGIIGEGGSGGALALAVADKVFMQEHSVYSILSPEGFASILWKDASKAKEAASRMKITAQELLAFDVIDDIVAEPVGGAHKKPEVAAANIKQYILKELEILEQMEVEELLEKRYMRFRKIGRMEEIQD